MDLHTYKTADKLVKAIEEEQREVGKLIVCLSTMESIGDKTTPVPITNDFTGTKIMIPAYKVIKFIKVLILKHRKSIDTMKQQLNNLN